MKKYHDLIERLADKTLSFGCVVQFRDCEKFKYASKSEGFIYLTNQKGGEFQEWKNKFIKYYKILGHDIMIGDVLEKIKETKYDERGNKAWKLMLLWQPLGFTKSLQEILTANTDESKKLFNFLIEIL